MTKSFQESAAGFPDPFHLIVRESVASTNDEIRSLASSGGAEGLILLALEQTSGRGRRGASWFSPAGESLAFSILLRPTEPQALWPRLALTLGLAVAEAIGSFGIEAGIKWPNDVWIRGRKVSGILVEAGADFVIAGIGLNIDTDVFPPEVAGIATSLKLESGRSLAHHEVLAAVIRSVSHRHRQIGRDFGEVLDAIRRRCVLSGHRVTLSTSSGPKQGTVEGIAPGGELILRTGTNIELLVQADEVRILD